MLRVLLCLIFIHFAYSIVDFPSLEETNEIQASAVKNLIKRLIGHEKSRLFQVEVRNKSYIRTDEFTLKKQGDSIFITGTTGVAVTYGFHYYLKNYCNCHVSWDTDQLKLPDELPDVEITVNSFDRFRYYQNVCTYSYSYVWWSWERWEREIDWMALNGINFALAFTAQEAIWRKIYKNFNMTTSEINEHFTGPAFLAWGRMGNIRGWLGPLSQDWHSKSVILQHKILIRMKKLGIVPILPAFCGHVPRAFKRLFPNVKMTMLQNWVSFPNKYCCPYIIDPNEKLFQIVGKLFNEELRSEFGTITHFYNCDPFNEMKPPSSDQYYLKNITSVIFNTMLNSDPNATWILQGWTFGNDPEFWSPEKVSNFLSGVQNNRMIILDLQSEQRPQYIRLKSYFGKPFIWCMLHNFGGTLGMHGSFDYLNTRVFEARHMVNSTMIGTGLTPEGINQNYVMYDFMTEISWRNISINIDLWIEKYIRRRYGNENENLNKSWKLLKNSVYNYKLTNPIHGQYILCIRPNLKHLPWTWYNTSDVFRAWDLFLNVTETEIIENLNYKHDLIDLTRQVFQLFFDYFFQNLVNDYHHRNTILFKNDSFQLLNILQDLNVLLSTNNRFMLGDWLREAELRANSPDEKLLFKINAKNQITLWGPRGEELDYATKQWAGVVSDYYFPRWQLFCKYLYTSLSSKIPFDQKEFNQHVFHLVEKRFPLIDKKYPFEPQNDTIIVVKVLYNKWRHIFTNNVTSNIN